MTTPLIRVLILTLPREACKEPFELLFQGFATTLELKHFWFIGNTTQGFQLYDCHDNVPIQVRLLDRFPVSLAS